MLDAQGPEAREMTMSKSKELKVRMRSELTKIEGQIAGRQTRLEELSEQGADFTDSGHRASAEAKLGQAEDTLKKAYQCTKVATPETVKMFRRHAIAIVAKLKDADRSIDAFEDEIEPPSAGMAP